MNTTTLKLIAVGLAGGLLGFVAARIYFHPSPAPHVPHVSHAQNEKSMNPVEPVEPAEPEKPAEPAAPTISVEQIDTTNPFNNKKFDPILDDKEYVIGFMYKMEALKKALTRPPSVSIPKKIGHAAFDHKTRDLLL